MTNDAPDDTVTSDSDADRAAVAAAVERARHATTRLTALGRTGRASLLDDLADALDARRDDIVEAADAETALGPARLTGELARTSYQFRFFAAVLREGSYLEATIDHAGPTPMGPRPDLRRMLVPVGPVAVYAASNFPLAFSVPGGDTVSALAAGNGVVVKVHPAHPRTSELVGGVIAQLAGDAVTLVHGFGAGRALVQEPGIRAASFTGSIRGGRALADLAAARADPIPFFGELGSVNPVLVTPAAAEGRGVEIAAGLAASVTLGGGQFCTKPGVVLLPAGGAGDALVEYLRAELARVAPTQALSHSMADAYAAGVAERAADPRAIPLLAGTAEPGWTTPALIEVPVGGLGGVLGEECFGPLTVVARYEDDAEAEQLIAELPGSLTGTLLLGRDAGSADADEGVPRARQALRSRSGRLVYNGYPTGVAVSWAQHHGGDWPSTNSQFTSVGAGAIRRFLKPVAWQDAPQGELPPELRDGDAGVPRRVDGVLR